MGVVCLHLLSWTRVPYTALLVSPLHLLLIAAGFPDSKPSW